MGTSNGEKQKAKGEKKEKKRWTDEEGKLITKVGLGQGRKRKGQEERLVVYWSQEHTQRDSLMFIL